MIRSHNFLSHSAISRVAKFLLVKEAAQSVVRAQGQDVLDDEHPDKLTQSTRWLFRRARELVAWWRDEGDRSSGYALAPATLSATCCANTMRKMKRKLIY
jgi:hypothetical protein